MMSLSRRIACSGWCSVRAVAPTAKHGPSKTVLFMPVTGQPLASNRYYAVIATGDHKGLVRMCSREEDRIMCCFCCSIVRHVQPRPFDPTDVYQQMEIVQTVLGKFTARAVADDGIPYKMYRQTWSVFSSKANYLDIGKALGLDAALRNTVRATPYADAVLFVSVPDQPLLSNRYYAIIASGKHKGKVRMCSPEEDMVPCCFCRYIKDVQPRPFDPADVYQQIKIVQKRPGRFTAKAVAVDTASRTSSTGRRTTACIHPGPRTSS
ncbi:hypothetical protein PR202_ga20913 [Eleusine coracana subsp. coracana]|uniref:Uncharacterized protein n=1 Tax=Eleusine coracana subsp. coracana TaxID=191504 RepID=A0AAV5CZT0_ELECO|nr:hypothetical protein PR202_ga20913 [Eleusine coracana subsp. coracana]